MSPTLGESLVGSLANYGVAQFWGVVGDALNPIVDALRREDRVEWIGVRHEEAAAFAASAQSQLTGRLAVCMGTVGPGAVHLLNGLYDAAKAHTPVLAIVGQVDTTEIGSDFFQEVDNDSVFADCSVFAQTVTAPEQFPQLLEQAVNTAVAEQGVAVLSIASNIAGSEIPSEISKVQFAPAPGEMIPGEEPLAVAARALNEAEKVTLLVGCGARDARAEVLELADTLASPMVLTLKAKWGLEGENQYEVGQAGLIGNPAAIKALHDCDTLLCIGTDFPYRDWYPEHKKVIQLDWRSAHIGRRTHVDHALVGHARPTLRALLPQLRARSDRSHLDAAVKEYKHWLSSQYRLADPRHDERIIGKIRSLADNPEEKIRPEAIALALDKACADDAVFTSDTGMSTVWLSRLLPMRGDRQLVGSYNLGSMANAMPMALGAQSTYPGRQVVSLCGDGGLMMLLGDLRTAVTYDLPAVFCVFNNSKLGMVKLEQEQVGLPEFGTQLDNPNFADVARALGLGSRRVEDPSDIAGAIQEALNARRPYLLDFVTNPNEVSVPPQIKPGQAFGFARSKITEFFSDPGPTAGKS